MTAISKMTQVVIVPDTVMEYHIPDFVEQDMTAAWIDEDEAPWLDDRPLFREVVSRYNPNLQEFEPVTLSNNGQRVQVVHRSKMLYDTIIKTMSEAKLTTDSVYWRISKTLEPHILKLKSSTTGQYMVESPYKKWETYQLMGYPVRFDEDVNGIELVELDDRPTN